MPTNPILAAAVDELLQRAKAIAGTLPADIDAQRQRYTDEIEALARAVLAGQMTVDEARYELAQAKSALVQSIGTAGLNVFGKRRAVLAAAVETGLSMALRVALGALAA